MRASRSVSCPTDVRELECDILSATGRKFLRGPRGTGFLYVRQGLIEQLEPPFLDLHAAEWDDRDTFSIRADARRFENWETSYATKLGLAAAVDYALGLGAGGDRGACAGACGVAAGAAGGDPGGRGARPRRREVRDRHVHRRGRAGVRGRASASAPRGVNVSVTPVTYSRLDLVCVFDALHDMGDPVGAARHVRSQLAEDGTWMIVEPMAGDTIEENLNPVGRVFYAGSTMLCTPNSLSQDVGLALGAQAGEQQLTAVLREGGFTRVRRSAETPFNLVLEARR